jgi:hypothetical protein
MRRLSTSRSAAPPIHWPSLLPNESRAEWEDLRAWVEQFVDRFAIDTHTVPPCWFRHNSMVEALAALRDHERGSYGDSTARTTAVDWLRAVRDIAAFLKESAARTGCTAAEHRPEPRARWSVDEGEWAHFVGPDQAQRTAILSEAQLDDE